MILMGKADLYTRLMLADESKLTMAINKATREYLTLLKNVWSFNNFCIIYSIFNKIY